MAIETTASEALEMRLARLESGCERMGERLGTLEQRLTALEPRLASGLTSLRYEMLSALDSLRSELRAGETQMRTRMTGQFYWLLTLILGSILVPILRGLAR